MHGLHPFINKTEDMDICLLFLFWIGYLLTIILYIKSLCSWSTLCGFPIFKGVWKKIVFSCTRVCPVSILVHFVRNSSLGPYPLSFYFSLSEERLQLGAQFCFGITWFDWLTSRNGHLSLLTFLIFISNKLSSSSISCNDGVNKRVLYYM